MGYAGVPNTMTMTLIGSLAVAGAALGVGLGRSAIDEIDPAYFKDPEAAFHGDLAANHPTDWAQVQTREYAQAAAPITQCIGCIAAPPPDFPVEYVPGRDPYVETSTRAWPVRRQQAAPPAVQVVYEEEAPPAADPARERIVRYASYPVTQEEARAMAERDRVEAQAPEDDEGSAATQ